MTSHVMKHLKVYKTARLEVRCGYAFDFTLMLGLVVAGVSVAIGSAGVSGHMSDEMRTVYSWLAPNVPAFYAVAGWRRLRLRIEPKEIAWLMLLGWVPVLAGLLPIMVWAHHLFDVTATVASSFNGEAAPGQLEVATRLAKAASQTSMWPDALAGAVTAAWYIACLILGLPRPRHYDHALLDLEAGMAETTG